MRPKRYWAWRIARALMSVVLRIVLKLDLSGVSRIPDEGAVALVGNHTNSIDPVLAYTIQDRYVKGMTAKETYRRPGFNIFAWAVEAIPVERGAPDRPAIRACVQALQHGQALYIAPEGTRSHDGRLQSGKAGITLILLRAGTQIPIFPLGFVGLEDFWPNLRHLRRTPARVVVGEPFWLDPPEGRVRREVRDEMIDEIMIQIARLLPPKNHGVYAGRLDETPQYLRFTPPEA